MSAVAPTEPSLSIRFALVISGLRQAIAARGPRHPGMVPLIVQLWGRLHRVVARFDVLLAQFRAGRLAAARPARARRAQASRPASATARLPRGVAWLVRLMPETAAFGSQLEHVLADPEIAALLAASPAAGRLLRPLCRMFAVRPGPGFGARRRRRPIANSERANSERANSEPPSSEPPSSVWPAISRRPRRRPTGSAGLGPEVGSAPGLPSVCFRRV